ncbi:glycerophosphodiester phosphodiesterase family protein [Planktotalea sp.]|uniref:glycerophosphodiester phosphodiesterase family protein n=1 Tax=Planktotalea sp. TaxID=2029877 RepID=UPI003D6A6536
MNRLDPQFLTVPLTHRALHDVSKGRPENSRAAINAAIDAGYGVEIDVQLSSDDKAIVFHDYDLARLAEAKGPIRQRTSDELGKIRLRGNDESIPGLPEILSLVSGRVPLLIEIKDQDGAMGPNVGLLEQAVARDIAGYKGALAVMSFNPYSVKLMGKYAPDVTRGIVTSDFRSKSWLYLPKETRKRLRKIPDFDDIGASFISHGIADLTSKHVAKLKSRGVDVLCWTVKSEQQEKEARKVADNITFEQYLAKFPDQ